MTNTELITPTQIIKSKRKTISLIIKDNADFIVRAPMATKSKDIENFIKEKADWIIKKRNEQIANMVKPISFKEGECICFS